MIVDVIAENPTRNLDGVTIDINLQHPLFGWIPFTASPDDIEEHGRAIYQACLDGQFGPITELVL